MQRTDQFIGFNKSGQEVYNKLLKTPGQIERKIEIGVYAFSPDKIFGSEIILNNKIYREEIQIIPWSSGPMYFTRIGIYDKETNKKIGTIGDWKQDPNVMNEYDYETGTFWI